MNKLLFFSGFSIAVGLSLLLLYNRKKKWNTNKFRFLLTGAIFIIGIICLIIVDNPTRDQKTFFLWLLPPLINSLLDNFFRIVSYRIHGRDLLLYLRGSSDLDARDKNPNLKTSDYFFSIILLIAIWALPLYGIW